MCERRAENSRSRTLEEDTTTKYSVFSVPRLTSRRLALSLSTSRLSDSPVTVVAAAAADFSLRETSARSSEASAKDLFQDVAGKRTRQKKTQ